MVKAYYHSRARLECSEEKRLDHAQPLGGRHERLPGRDREITLNRRPLKQRALGRPSSPIALPEVGTFGYQLRGIVNPMHDWPRDAKR